MSELLVEVRRAARAKRRADETYRLAVAAAFEAGETGAAVGEAAGVTRQAARRLALRVRGDADDAAGETLSAGTSLHSDAPAHAVTITRRGSGWGFRCSCGEEPNQSSNQRSMAAHRAELHVAAAALRT